MFPRANRPDRPAHAWLDAVRHGLDLLVAFATLRGAEAPPENDETTFGAGFSWPRADSIPPATAAGRRRAAERDQPAADPSEHHTADRSEWRTGKRAAAGRSQQGTGKRAAAGRSQQGTGKRATAGRSEQGTAPFTTRASAKRTADRSQPRAAERADPPAAHPHRRPLRPAARHRRPGAVRPEPQPCLTPIVPRRARPTRAPARGARH